jgi:hypothetical protein
MRPRLPSPAMVVALIALIVALSGTAVAAVTYAHNAGAVNGISAVRPNVSTRHAAGKLVATKRHGRDRGRVPAKYLAGVMRGSAQSLTNYVRTVDNTPGAPHRLLSVRGVGRMDAQCADVDPTPGTATTRTTVTFTATAPQGANVSRILGRDIEAGQRPNVFTAPHAQAVTILPSADGLFQVLLQAGQRSVLVVGAARTDSSPGPRAACLLWGTAFTVG